MKHDKKPGFNGMYAGLFCKCLAVAIAVAMQMVVCAVELPGAYDATLSRKDTSKQFSLTTGFEDHGWKDANGNKTAPISEDSVGKNFRIESGARARASEAVQVILPNIYCFGQAVCSQDTTFNNLYLCENAEYYRVDAGVLYGNVTVLSEKESKPAKLIYHDTSKWGDSFKISAKVTGSKDSHLLYQTANGGKGWLHLWGGTDWSGFYGTLHIEDGAAISNRKKVPVSISGTVRLGSGCSIRMADANAPLSFGALSFEKNGAITNDDDNATLTVTGEFNTGLNLRWLSRNTGTFGTLILGDGLTLIDDQTTPTTVLTVEKKLEVGENITIEYPNVTCMPASDMNPVKIHFMTLKPDAVAEGIPDLSGVKVLFKEKTASQLCHLTVENVESGECRVYATLDPIVCYNGADEWTGGSGVHGNWVDREKTKLPEFQWSDGAYPDGAKLYCTPEPVFWTGAIHTFPGLMLLCRQDFYMTGSGYVTNFLLSASGIVYVRAANLHLGGNLTPVDDTKIRVLGDRAFYLDSALHGSEKIILDSYNPGANGGATFHLTADNSDWTGMLSTTWDDGADVPDAVADENTHIRVVVADAKSLGGNPSSYVYNALPMYNFLEFRFTDTTVQTASNRGIGVNNGIIRVDLGKTADLTAPVTLVGTLRKKGEGTLGFGGGIRFNKNNNLESPPSEGKNILLVEEGAIKCSSLIQAAVTFSDGTGIAADEESGAMDLTEVGSVTAPGVIYLKADVNTVPEPTQAVTYPVVKVTAEQANTFGTKFKAAKSPWQGWPVTVVTETDESGNVTYSVKYEKKGFVFSIR